MSVSEKLQKAILSRSKQTQAQKMEYINNNLNPIVGSPVNTKMHEI